MRCPKHSQNVSFDKLPKKGLKEESNNVNVTDDVVEENDDKLSSVILNNRSNQSKGSWRVMPKDSCELYKERRKRRREDDIESLSTDSEYDSPVESKKEKRQSRKTPPKRSPAKKKVHYKKRKRDVEE